MMHETHLSSPIYLHERQKVCERTSETAERKKITRLLRYVRGFAKWCARLLYKKFSMRSRETLDSSLDHWWATNMIHDFDHIGSLRRCVRACVRVSHCTTLYPIYSALHVHNRSPHSGSSTNCQSLITTSPHPFSAFNIAYQHVIHNAASKSTAIIETNVSHFQTQFDFCCSNVFRFYFFSSWIYAI